MSHAVSFRQGVKAGLIKGLDSWGNVGEGEAVRLAGGDFRSTLIGKVRYESEGGRFSNLS